MAVTYPLSVPSGLKVRDSSFRIMRAVSISESPFTFATQTSRHEGERWEGEVTLIAFNHTQAGVIISFLTSLKGKFGNFLFGDPDFLAKGVRGSNGGTPLVDGASQTGNTLNVKGLLNNITGVWLPGDYIQTDTGSNSELYMVVESVDSDGTGKAAVVIEPKLKSSPADSEAIVTTGAKGVFRLVANSAEWQSDRSSVYRITFAFQEVINV